MANKVINIDDVLWLRFKKLCAINETTMKEQVSIFVEEYNKKYGGLIK